MIMTKSNRLGTALTAVSLVAVVAACAGPGSNVRSASMFGGKVNSGELPLATKAQMALATNNVAEAIGLAERAVEGSPQDAGFRALLGNCYLAAGRFASAEAAYRDALSIYGNQPQVILKLALVQIAQGKGDSARLLLAEAGAMVDPADAGLALALAGDAQSAVAVLEPAARQVGADARTRQNLALAYAFAGDWQQARTVAAQDVPADQLDARLHQWMALAQPVRASDQVAAFIGVQPAAADPGLPVRLALHSGGFERQAAAEIDAIAVPVAQPEMFAETTPEAYAPEALAAAAPIVPENSAPVAERPARAPVAVAEHAPASSVTIDLPPPAPYVAPEPVKLAEARPALSPAAVRLGEPLPKPRKAAAQRSAGKSSAVVQLGAYSSRERIEFAWNKAAGKFGSLKSYTPVTAKFTGGEGVVYRLAVKGFSSEREALDLCKSLKRAGRDCFVRSASGDAPVKFASR